MSFSEALDNELGLMLSEYPHKCVGQKASEYLMLVKIRLAVQRAVKTARETGVEQS